MKSLPLISAAIFMLSFSAPLHASDIDPVISTQQEEGLEADHDTMQIRDLEAESKNAKEQAEVQGQMAREAKGRLDAVLKEKDEKLAKAKKEIKAFEDNRKAAEIDNKGYVKQTAKLKEMIKNLEDSTVKAKAAAKIAQDIANAGHEELARLQERKTQLEAENRQALSIDAQAEGELNKLKTQYAEISASVKQLEERLQLLQAESKKKLMTKAQLNQEIATAQNQEAKTKGALGIKPVAKAPSKVVPANAASAQISAVDAQSLDQ